MKFFKQITYIPLSEITPAVIAGWKLKYADVYEIVVEGKQGFFRNVTTQEIKSGELKKVFGSNSVETAIKTIKLTFLGGDFDFKNSDDFAVSAFNQLQPIFEKKVKRILSNVKF